ncbi:MAG: domain containing protein [Crocinitomicaceae bacterium]|jgi:gliding motility-associated-like protein|nr:domain containing protein [Crocinitomicaceae bacterium]
MKNLRGLLLVSCLLGIKTVFSQQTNIIVDASSDDVTFNTCNGFIIDSGGQGGTGYSNNENVTFTICPDNPDDIVNVTFNLFNLDTYDQNPAPNVTVMDRMLVFDGSSTSGNFLGEYTGTQLQGVLIQCSPQNTSGCLTFQFISNNNNNTNGFFSGSAQCVTPCDDPVAAGRVQGGFTNDSIHACIGEVLNFQDMGSFAQNGFTIANYEWDFMDGSSEEGANVSHAYTIPGHYRVQLFVTDNNGCTNNNLTDIDVLIATKPTFINFHADTTLCVGESLNAVATPLLYENTWTGFSGTTTIDDGCLPDTLLGIAQSIDVTQTGFSSGSSITNADEIVSLCLELEHSFMGDLVVMVTCPNGQEVILHQQGGGGTQLGVPVQDDNVDCSDPTTQGEPFNYCFDNASTQTWVEYADDFGGTLPAGSYEPVQPLSGLVGCPTNGVWTLTVVDNWAADDGTVFSFGIQLDSSLYADVVEFTPQLSASADSSYWTFPAIYASNLSADADAMTITPTAPGSFTYVYNMVNSFGCHDDTNFVVNVFDFDLPFTLEDTTICAGNEISMINSDSDCDYTLTLRDSYGDGWNGNFLIVTVNGGPPMQYTVEDLDGDLEFGEDTEATFSIPLSFGDVATFEFSQMGSFPTECSYILMNCTNDLVLDVPFPYEEPIQTISIGPFTYPVSFEWTPANVFGDQANVPNPHVLISEDVTATVNVYPTGHPLCAESASMHITIQPDSYIGMDSTVTICQTSTPENLFVYLGPGANPNGTWEGPDGMPVTMPLDPVTMAPGDYVYTVVNNVCVGHATVTVIKASPTIISVVPQDATCVNADNGSVTVTAQTFSTYSLNGGAHIPAQSPFTIPNLGEGNYTLVLYGTSMECNASATFFIDDPDSLEITFITDTTVICNGAPAVLTADVTGGSSPYIFTWTLNGAFVSNQQTVTVTPELPYNTYCLTLTEQCNSTSVTRCTVVEFEPNLIPDLSTDQNICTGDTSFFMNITNSPNVMTSMVWFGDGDSLMTMGLNSFSHMYNSIGTYDVSILTVSQNGCVYTNSFPDFVRVNQNPEANFMASPDILTTFEPNADLVNISSPDAIYFSWYTPGSLDDTSTLENPHVQYPLSVPGEYNVKLVVTNLYGCSDSIIKTIKVEEVMTIYIPNSFTPNGDEFNNVWAISLNGIDIYNFKLTVYNRWGQLIFESHDPSIGWDGTFNNQLVQAGLYQWRMEGIETLTDTPFERFGYVNIFR